jgi:hypothetical protein
MKKQAAAQHFAQPPVLSQDKKLSQFSKIVPINTAYLRYAVCGCCLCIKNANCYSATFKQHICDMQFNAVAVALKS